VCAEGAVSAMGCSVREGGTWRRGGRGRLLLLHRGRWRLRPAAQRSHAADSTERPWQFASSPLAAACCCGRQWRRGPLVLLLLAPAADRTGCCWRCARMLAPGQYVPEAVEDGRAGWRGLSSMRRRSDVAPRRRRSSSRGSGAVDVIVADARARLLHGWRSTSGGSRVKGAACVCVVG
jgi:hypothetical protein